MMEIDKLLVSIVKITDKQEHLGRIHTLASDIHNAQITFQENFSPFVEQANNMTPEKVQVNTRV